jgi:hypothetical protein
MLTYTLADRVPYNLQTKILKEYNGPKGVNDQARFIREKVKAVYINEFRPVKPGEWYLSGAEVQAYLAKNGTNDAFHIARLVFVETQTIVTHKLLPIE